jgi:methionine aminotransferase
MFQLKSKLPQVGTTIFTVMSKMAKQYDAINLAQGFPDFDGPQALRDRVSHHMANGHNQYAPLSGVPVLCKQLVDKVYDLYGCEIDPERELTITPGATEAIYCAITAVVNPGDEVIVFDPAYDSYSPTVKLNGGITRHIQTRYPDFAIDWDEVRAAINSKTRLIILNTPHNPSGTTWSQSDIDHLREVVAGTAIYILSDEVYEHMVFDGHEHLSVLRYPELAERCFAVYSFGKTYHATGWRVGYCIAPESMMKEFLRLHQFLKDCPEHHLSLSDFYQQKRDLFCELMAASRFKFKPCAGTFFQTADYSEISDEVDTEFAARLTREHKVAVIPISVFYQQPPDQRVVRFCFAKDDETLREAARRLVSL